jgi:Zn-dependent alcohol dehydrogenase
MALELLERARADRPLDGRRARHRAFLSHRISLDEVNTGFELMEAQDGIRSVIGFT